MQELVIATNNNGKLREIKELLKNYEINITSLADYPKIPKIEENGQTFSENAVIKAVTVAQVTGKLTMGEDSGLEVKALGNRPGIYSARYSGEGANDKKNNRKLLKDLTGVPLEKRQARYRCCMALATEDKVVTIVHGSCRGLIGLESRGPNGFGYDPLFIIPAYDKTFGELDPAIKAKISHRSRALKKMKKFILAQYGL